MGYYGDIRGYKWDTPLMEKVEKIQYQAALAVTGSWKCSSRIKLYEELGWEALSDRRRYRRVLQVHTIENNKIRCYLKDKLTATNVIAFMK